jgi:arylformamidase
MKVATSDHSPRRPHWPKKLLKKGAFTIAAASLAFGVSTVNAGNPPVPGAAALEYIDLNHAITHEMSTYPGLSMVKFSDMEPRFPNHALIDQVSLLGITGTYIDAPFHVFPDGKTISDYPLSKLVNLPVVVVTKPESRQTFEIVDFKNLDLEGKAVLLFSGHAKKFNTPEYAINAPYLAIEAARWLVSKKVALVGIDGPLIDNFADSSAIPVHHELLEHGVVICEDMTNLGALPMKGAFLTAAPPRVPMTSFPARVFATVQKH